MNGQKMASKPEEEIEVKLRQLEANLKEETGGNVPAAREKKGGMSAFDKLNKKSSKNFGELGEFGGLTDKDEESSMHADLNMLGGGVLTIFGFILVLSHIHVTSGGGGYWGMGNYGAGEGGMVILGIIIGFGMIFYNYKNLFGWLVVLGTLVGTVLLVLSRLHLWFDPMNMLSLIFIFLPFALGGALIAKGLVAHHKADEKSKETEN